MSDARRVLLLSYAFPPMAMPESMLAAKRMGNLGGREVEVVSAGPLTGWIREDRSLDAYTAGRFARVTRLRLPPALRALPLGRLSRLLTAPDQLRLLNAAARRAVRARGLARYGAIVTWSQWHSVHLVGLALRRPAGAPPWVAHFSDPWSTNPFFARGPIARRVNQGQERRVIRAADRLLFTSEETVELVMAPYPAAWRTKVRVLPHAFEPALFPAGPAERTGPLILRYLGSFYGPRTPEPLFAALARLRRRSPALAESIRVELIGSVAPDMLASRTCRDLPRELVTVRPPVDYVRSLELMQGADLLLVIDAPAASSPFLPSKLVDYLGARRPILGLTPPGAAASLVICSGGWVADPAQPAAIDAALERALEWLGRHRGEEFGDPAVRARYAAATVGAQMEAVLAELTG